MLCFCCTAKWLSYIYILFFKLIYLFLAVLGLHCCMWAFSSCGGWGILFVAMHGLLIRWLLLLRSTGSRLVGFSSCGSWALERRLSSCGTRAYLFRSMWDLPRPGLEPMSPALAGRFLTTVPPGKSLHYFFLIFFSIMVYPRRLDIIPCAIQ